MHLPVPLCVLILLVAQSVPTLHGQNRVHMQYPASQDPDSPNSATECPPWFISNENSSSRCVCSDAFPEVVRCDQVSQKSFLRLGYCMTYNENLTESTLIGSCPYLHHYNVVDRKYIQLPQNTSQINDFICGALNRQGQLCGQCKEGYGPGLHAYGYQCKSCNEMSYFSRLILFMLVRFGPLTIFFIIVVAFQISVSSAPMNCFIFFSQVIVTTLTSKTLFLTVLKYELDSCSFAVFQLVRSFYGFNHLDFFRNIIPAFCVSSNIRNIHALVLDFVTASYPLCILAFIYAWIQLRDYNFKLLVWLCKPFRKCFDKVLGHCACKWCFKRSGDPKTSTIDVFATFLVFAYSKFLFASFSLLSSVQVYNISGAPIPDSPVLFWDTNVMFLSREHIPYAVLAIFILLVFIVPPPLLLILYPMKIFRKCLDCCKPRPRQVLYTFIEKFQGCIKDGTNGTCDFRSFSAVYFILRILFVLQFISTSGSKVPYSGLSWLVTGLGFVSIALFIALARPYKATYMNVLDSLLLALLGLLALLALTFLHLLKYVSEKSKVLPILIVMLAAIPQFCLTVYISYKLLSWVGVTQYAQGKCKALKSCLRSKQYFDVEAAPDRLVNPENYTPLGPATEADFTNELHMCSNANN